jgi:hypothetical protein
MAEHTHDHAHAHDHDHDGGDSYFIDQLCMVGLSGAFGVICLCLWFWQPAPPKTPMLQLILGEQFHIYVLLSGIVLSVLAVTRAALLWQQSRDPAFLKTHDHEHHDHGHDHAHDHKHDGVDGGHDHAHGETCGHDHGHEHHAQAHHAHDDHDKADHDHGWAPWRYVVILVPIILFLLGLPDKPPSIMAKDKSDIALATLPELACFGAAYDVAESLKATSGKAKPVDFKLLEVMASKPDLRDYWKNSAVEVRGQFSPVRGTDRQFMLVRLKISCCANDAVQLDVPMLSRESLAGLKDPETGAEIKHGDWVKVTGRVEFREVRPGSFMTVLIIAKAGDIRKCDPDPNPYIQ